jgi:hypothetical protein
VVGGLLLTVATWWLSASAEPVSFVQASAAQTDVAEAPLSDPRVPAERSPPVSLLAEPRSMAPLPAGLRGRLLAPDGTPAVGCKIRASAKPSGTVLLIVESGEQGDFLLQPLPPGTVWLQAESKHGLGQRAAKVYADAVVQLGEIVLHPGPQVRGVCLDTKGNAVREVRIRAFGPGAFKEVRSGGGGAFHLGVLAAGTWAFEAEKPGYQSGMALRRTFAAQAEHAQVPLTLKSMQSCRGWVGVDGRAAAGAEIHYQGALLGTSEEDGSFAISRVFPTGSQLEVRARGAVPQSVRISGDPAEMLSVDLRSGWRVVVTALDAAGHEGVHLSDLQLWRLQSRWRPLEDAEVQLQPQPWVKYGEAGTFRVRASAAGGPSVDSDPFEVRDLNAAPASWPIRFPSASRLLIQVRSGIDQRGLPGALVSLVEGSSPRQTFSRGDRVRATRVAREQGWAEFPVLPGPYWLWIEFEGFAPRRSPNLEVDGSDQQLVVDLLPGARVSGQLESGEHAGLGGIRVTALHRDGFFRSTISDPRGVFEFPALPPGSYCFTVRHPDWPRPAWQPTEEERQTRFEFLEGQRSSISLGLPGLHRGRVRGTLLIGGEVRAQVQVCWYLDEEDSVVATDAGPREGFAVTDEIGRFAFRGVPAGEVVLCFETPGGELFSDGHRLIVAAGDEVAAAIDLPVTSLEVIVLSRSSRRPVPAAKLHLFLEETFQAFVGEADAEGICKWPLLPAGRFDLEVRAAGFFQHHQPLDQALGSLGAYRQEVLLDEIP